MIVTAHAPVDEVDHVLAELRAAHCAAPLTLIILFVSAAGDLRALTTQAEQNLPGTPIIGCTTAGEIGPTGYLDGHVVALGLPASHFIARTELIGNLTELDANNAAERVARARVDLETQEPKWRSSVAFMLVDGLSLCEDQLVAALRPGLGSTQLFGGSAGDGLNFAATSVFAGTEIAQDAAVIALIRSRCPIEVFKSDHFEPTETKMVVTDADPERRIVREINAAPAAREYARMVGKDPDQLSPFIFAAHPVVVKVGGQHHVRAIQKVEPNGDLTFFSAIDEGLVLTVAKPVNMVDHLDQTLSRFTNGHAPEMFIGCDCILRRLEAEQYQANRHVSDVLSKHNVIGFNTYGEQWQSVHVNQTFTGAAIFPPDDE